MNLFSEYQQKILLCLKVLEKEKKIILPKNFSNLTIELPPKDQTGDISCSVAMVLAKTNRKNPFDLAKILKEIFMKNFNEINEIYIVKPGFINIKFKINFWNNFLSKIIKSKFKYGSQSNEIKKYNIEFVSANPTGPLHVGHCRGAVLGDTLANLLKFNGHTVMKEYYVNDHGGQINNFVESVFCRIIELTKGKKFPLNKDLYPGTYIIDIAKKIIKDKKITNFDNLEIIKNELTKQSLNYSLELIKKNLELLGVEHDNFIFESKLISNRLVEHTIDKLKKNDYAYIGKLKAPKGELTKNWKTREQLLFRSSVFGDDIDRSLKKSDNSWTYFASDIAYHSTKIERNFDVLINILGADHSGYIKRIVAAVKAISKNKVNLICKVSQLVKLFRDGKPYKMSKRMGDYVTLEDLVNEVGKDSVRFMMLSRSNDVELDFDFKKVTEKSKDNPVFYVQYAYARINSIFRSLNKNIEDSIILKDNKSNLNKYEVEILKKISQWPRCIEISSTRLEPHRISYYLYDLVTLFHFYWSLGKDKKEYRFISDSNISSNRLLLLQILSVVIKNGMSILGVSTPKSM